MKWLIALSFGLAFILMVMPIGFQWRAYRPEFVVLMVVYWSMFAPQHFGLTSAWLIGLFQDLLELSPLGLNAIGMLLVSYISYLVYQRIRNYVLWHQAVWIFVLIGIFQLFSNWVGGLVGRTIDGPMFLVAAIISSFLWPLVVVLMRNLTVRLRLL